MQNHQILKHMRPHMQKPQTKKYVQKIIGIMFPILALHIYLWKKYCRNIRLTEQSKTNSIEIGYGMK